MVILITGGAGFIGRWVVERVLKSDEDVIVLDNLENGLIENLEEFRDNSRLKEIVINDICNKEILLELFHKYKFDICIHLAAQINVHESLKIPQKSFKYNVLGTFNVLEAAKHYGTKVVIVGTCMVYDMANVNSAISETHQIKPTSPYAGSKLAAEDLALSYFFGLRVPVVILRPFNTYGPFQKTNMEGGVVSIFVQKMLKNENLLIYGDGTQTRDLLYVKDCAEFIYRASKSQDCVGEVLNAGTGQDISMNELADMIAKDQSIIKHVPHHHPQSEIMKLVCDYSKAKRILNWEPKTTLKDGINKLEKWIRKKELNL